MKICFSNHQKNYRFLLQLSSGEATADFHPNLRHFFQVVGMLLKIQKGLKCGPLRRTKTRDQIKFSGHRENPGWKNMAAMP